MIQEYETSLEGLKKRLETLKTFCETVFEKIETNGSKRNTNNLSQAFAIRRHVRTS